jgi:hypothetical protein
LQRYSWNTAPGEDPDPAGYHDQSEHASSTFKKTASGGAKGVCNRNSGNPNGYTSGAEGSASSMLEISAIALIVVFIL